MNTFLRYLADKNSAHTHRHTPLTTRPGGLRRAGNDHLEKVTGVGSVREGYAEDQTSPVIYVGY